MKGMGYTERSETVIKMMKVTLNSNLCSPSLRMKSFRTPSKYTSSVFLCVHVCVQVCVCDIAGYHLQHMCPPTHANRPVSMVQHSTKLLEQTHQRFNVAHICGRGRGWTLQVATFSGTYERDHIKGSHFKDQMALLQAKRDQCLFYKKKKIVDLLEKSEMYSTQ